MVLSLLSLNVNGLKDKKKRQTLFQWIKDNNVDICLLQETHCCTLSESRLYSNEWGGKCYWVLGTNSSKGVACLIKQNLDINIVSEEGCNEGRFQKIELEIDELKLSVMNIYAPNKVCDRKIFFMQLNKKGKE